MTQETRPNVTRPVNTPGTRSVLEDTQPLHAKRGSSAARQLMPWLIAIPAFALVVLGVAVVAGYSAGLKIREASGIENLAQVSQQQFDIGVEDLLAGRFELARQRFEYVLELDPHYPGAAELLGQVMTALNQPTPTEVPLISPTPTATPDLGSYESIFGSAQVAFSREDWDSSLNLLLILRSRDPSYKLTEVNQMMAVALRNRGMDKLYRGEIEQGVYDLNLAERFGPLDSQAVSWRQSAAFFMFANSYYGLDWGLAAEYLGQICVANIWGACAKYADAAREYALLLIEEGDYCRASFYMSESLAHRDDSRLAPTATKIASVCLTATVTPPTATPTPTGSVTPTYPYVSSTPTPTSIWFTATPTATGPASPTATATSGVSTATPTPTPTETITLPPPTPTSTPTSTPTE